MRRKTFDMILTAGGAVLVVMLLAAGGLGLWGYSFANSNVHNQLAQQQITFPSRAAFAHAKAGTEIEPVMIPYIEKYAGQPLTTGQQAEAYADHFIAYHLQEIGGGKTYSQLSAESIADPTNTKLAGSGGDGLQGHHTARAAPRGVRLLDLRPDRPGRVHRVLRAGRPHARADAVRRPPPAPSARGPGVPQGA